jgi:hypothetical protein
MYQTKIKRIVRLLVLLIIIGVAVSRSQLQKRSGQRQSYRRSVSAFGT